MPHKLLLMILDGWGIAPQPDASAIDQAHTPFIDSLQQKFPHTTLVASGEDVGLPAGQMGNSEVGHLNIGAGRVVDQHLVRINKSIASGDFFDNPTLQDTLDYARLHQKAVHVMGLVSDGGVHSHISHLKAICKAAHDGGVDRLWVHAFADGRDTHPQSVVSFLEDLEQHMGATTGRLASVMGRYYAMDRDRRLERTEIAYDALVHGRGALARDWRGAIEGAYGQGVTDEFLEPIVLTDDGHGPRACVEEGDVVICFNFRTDRSRQLMELLSQATGHAGMPPLGLYCVTMTVYDAQMQGVRALMGVSVLPDTLGEVLSRHGKRQLRISETEKYPHVTYFFSGGREGLFANEERILCPSPKVKTYDLVPAMAAEEITERVLSVLPDQSFDFICLNFANADMVGHTGNFEAAVQACQVVDSCAERVVEGALATGYEVLIVADHGNADKMRDAHGEPYTAHSTHPVPCILVGHVEEGAWGLRSGRLADVAPTVLTCMGIPVPAAMTGCSLLKSL